MGEPWYSMPNSVDGLRLIVKPLLQPSHGHVSIVTDDKCKIDLDHSDLIGLVQRKQDVRITLELNRTNEPIFACQLYYLPDSDETIFKHESSSIVEITRLNLYAPSIRIRHHQATALPGGIWQLNIESHPMVEWTSLPRELVAQRSSPKLERRLIKCRPSEADDTNQASEIRYQETTTDLQEGETLYLPSDNSQEAYQITMQKKVAIRDTCELFRAQHSSRGDCIVVKMLHTSQGRDPNQDVSQARTWLREYTVLIMMNDDTIVKLLDYDARYLALYMEDIPGADLGSGPWRNSDHYFSGTQEDAGHILTDCSQALSHMHAQGIQHKDIKPGNILYSRQRGAVICDFGLSERIESDEMRYAGTPWYIPPEFIRGFPRNAASDIFALGIVMLFLLKITPLPEKDARAKEWRIAHTSTEQTAMALQTHWMRMVEKLRHDLSSKHQLHLLARDLTENDPKDRPTAEELSIATKNLRLALPTDEPQAEAKSEEHSPATTEPLEPWVYGCAPRMT